MRVLVVGAGIGGMAAAVALRQAGMDVELIEIQPTFSVYGVGINQPANSLRALRSLGALDDCLAAGFQISQGSFYDQDGELIVTVPDAMGGDDVPSNNALSRADLHKSLIAATEREGIKIAYGTTLASFVDHGDRVDVVLSDGRQESFELVVGFDGIKSSLRRQLFGVDNNPVVYTGFAVWRVTLPRPPDMVEMRVYQALGVKAGFIPLSDKTMYMFVVTPEPAGKVYPQAEFGDLLRQRMAPFGALPGEVRDGIAGPEGIVFSPISDVMLPLPWFKGRVGVLGDAAHACAPHITQGAAMALEDAVVLAEELNQDGSIDDRLRRFEERRFPRARFVQDVSRSILQAEMSINADNYEEAIAGMRAHLVDQMTGVDQFLDAPA